MDSSANASAGISIVIPNYNGEQLLRENLPSIFAAAEQWQGPAEVIIVDDCSTDESCLLIRNMFPAARLLVNSVNSGFSKTCNIGMAAAGFSILLCINTDVKVEAHLLTALAPHFGDPELFAVTPRIIVEREGKNQGAVFGRCSGGFIKGSFASAEDELPERENLYAVGACVAYDAGKFRALGGYSEIYSPYLFEDVDISYRAWKRGWKSVYDPSVTVWHYSNATLGKVKRRTNNVIYYRNRFIFHWINVSDPSKVIWNMLNTSLRLMFSFLLLKFYYYEAFLGALKRRKAIADQRRKEKPFRTLRDADVIRRTSRNAR
ncbi:MAG TPA: glycosyltransferase [Dongiaceae bacterium]|nr:glycosyltransferase [Dongiaceae bacterium]